MEAGLADRKVTIKDLESQISDLEKELSSVTRERDCLLDEVEDYKRILREEGT